MRSAASPRWRRTTSSAPFARRVRSTAPRGRSRSAGGPVEHESPVSVSPAPVSTGFPDLDALQPRLEAIPSLPADALEAEHTAVLGRKSGVLTAALKSVAPLPVDDRKRYGAAVNQLKGRFEAAFSERRERLASERRRQAAAGVD